MRIAYFGQEGSFAHEAATRAFPKAKSYIAGVNSIGVLKLLYERKADCGVVPIENSSEGTIAETIDALIASDFTKSRFRIQEEITLTVRLHLLSNARMEEIQKVYSHPVPLNHLDGWLNEHLPGVQRIHSFSTSEGAMLAAGEPYTAAAIGNEAAGRIYGLRVLKSELLKRPNQTRFYIIARRRTVRSAPQKSAVCFGLPNTSGSLVTLLSIFAREKINLTRIISRPLNKREMGFRPNEYVFWVDFDGNPRLPRVSRALEKAREATVFLDVLGAYSTRLFE